MARPLTFHEIEAFRAIMLTGTTVAAARMLHTTQPTVSRLIAHAQQATGLELFHLRKGRLQPTQEAQQLFDTVQLYYRGAEKIEQAVAALRDSGTGVLRIACTPTLGLGVLPRALGGFRQRHPQVHATIDTLGSAQIQEGLMHGLYDIAFTNNSLDNDACRSEAIHTDNAVCVMSKHHPLTAQKTIRVRDLKKHALLYLHQGDSLGTELRTRLERAGVKPPSYIETSYYATLCMMAAEDLGVGIVNPYLVPVFSDKVAVRPFLPAIQVNTFASYSRVNPSSRLTPDFANAFRLQLEIVAQDLRRMLAAG